MPADSVWLMDTGPLVALLHSGDAFHAWAVRLFSNAHPRIATCEAVFTESNLLLRSSAPGRRGLQHMLGVGAISIEFSIAEQKDAIIQMLDKYFDAPMSLADACLVRMAEQMPRATVVTLDSHFRFYRKRSGQPIPAIMPPDK